MLKFNNTEVNKILFNGEIAEELKFNGTTVWEKPNEPLKFFCIDPEQTIKYSILSEDLTPTIYYSRDGNVWDNLEPDTELPFSTTTIFIKGDNPNGLSISSTDYVSFMFAKTTNIECSGNVMSLLGENVKEIPCDYCFYGLFRYYCTALLRAPELPATTLTNGCYRTMFYGCSNLITAPQLPATTLTYECYRDMFNSCTSLVNAPELPATTLTQSCYNQMFYGCRSLVNAPELPAAALANYCYQYMFNGCSSLNNVTILATDTSASACLFRWLTNTSSTGTFTKKRGVEYPTGESGIPEGWTVVEVD